MDYDRPSGATIAIGLSRRPADNPALRVGSLFVNPGGPGGPGRRVVTAVAALLDPAVLARYDIVGFDPRGIGASSPIRCFETDAEAEALRARIRSVPLTREQIDGTVDAYVEYTRMCRRNGGPLLTRMSTLNVARDLDRLRRAVGDPVLHYIGFSYGTLIGATYSNLYPDRVGTVILDGNVDPNRRTNHRLVNKFERAGGFEKALDGFLTACDAAGAPDCALGGGARAKFTALENRLRRGPAQAPDGSTVTIDDLYQFIGGALYSVAEFPETAEQLQLAYLALVQPGGARLSGGLLPKRAPRLGGLPDAPYSFNSDDAGLAVNCADGPLPRQPALYPAIAAAFERAHPTFGRGEAFTGLPCATWPKVRERYAGPWNRRTAHTILLVNSTFDPATPYVFAQRMARQLGNARLLTLDGFGHTSELSACVTDWYTRYLVAGELPSAGTRCRQDRAPFPPGASGPRPGPRAVDREP